MGKITNTIKEPVFFLFTCVKNGRKYINRLFESLLNQTVINFVHYIYEDGSDDPIFDLVEQYKEQSYLLDHPIKIYYECNKNNIGLNMATQHCISKANLPYFIWIDCDNWVHSRFFEFLGKETLKHPNAAAIRSDRITYFGSGLFGKAMSKRNSRKAIYSKHQFDYLCLGKYLFSATAFNKEFFFKVNNHNYFIDERSFFNDVQVNLSCAISQHPYYFQKKCIMYYLNRSDAESMVISDRSNEYIVKYLESINAPKNIIDRAHSLLLIREINARIISAYKKNDKKEAIILIRQKRKICRKVNIHYNTAYSFASDFYIILAMNNQKLFAVLKKARLLWKK